MEVLPGQGEGGSCSLHYSPGLAQVHTQYSSVVERGSLGARGQAVFSSNSRYVVSCCLLSNGNSIYIRGLLEECYLAHSRGSVHTGWYSSRQSIKPCIRLTVSGLICKELGSCHSHSHN